MLFGNGVFVMPHRRVSVGLRGIGVAFSRIFGVDARAPVGRLMLAKRGSGYFGNWRGERPSEGRELVFALKALPEHGKVVEKGRKHSWANPKVIAQTSTWFFPEKKVAIITVIQPIADLKRAGLSSRERSRYRYAEIASTMAGIEYCKRHGIRLFAVHPHNYQALHEQEGAMSTDIPSFYARTLENAAKGTMFKWKRMDAQKDSFWEKKTRFFGAELLELEAAL